MYMKINIYTYIYIKYFIFNFNFKNQYYKFKNYIINSKSYYNIYNNIYLNIITKYKKKNMQKICRLQI